MLDLVVKDAVLVDGTGAQRRSADLGIQDGRLVEIGRITGAAQRTISAQGQVAAPGFIDIHTHYDAQAFWDGSLSPSCYHGVTTAIGGNCGFSIAPLSGKPDDAEYLLNMLARVEGMPVASLRQGVPWNWRSFGEYLARLDGTLSINAGFMVGHSALRRTVMGERAVGHQASESELAAMVVLLRQSLLEGGMGLSSTVSPTHNDADGNPVPSRHAAEEEFLALARTVRDCPGTTLELLPGVGPFSDAEMERMAQMSLAANRPLNWNLISPASARPEFTEQQLAASDYAAKRGARVVGLCSAQPMVFHVNFASLFGLDSLPGWDALSKLKGAERKRAMQDPAMRRRLAAGATGEGGLFAILADWAGYTVIDVFAAENQPFRGKTLEQVAAMTGKAPLDAMFDIAVADDLKTSFKARGIGADEPSWPLRAQTWLDPRALVGGSDAGAHLDGLDTFAFSTTMLREAVTKRGLLSLEQAVQQLTQAPAELIGLTGRGVLREGAIADVVIFDPDRVGPGPVHTRFDLPTGAARLYADAEGVAHVLVAGTEIVRGNALTEARPGTVLRSGRDTHTVTVPGGGA
jgi:N-acyl-D-aspartate/D-glutamate deacylase